MIKYNSKTDRIEGKVKSWNGDGWIAINADCYRKTSMEELKAMQVSVYTMCGGGMLGSFAMAQPADFYIDSRVGRLPYKHTDIFKVIECLKAAAHTLKLNPHRLPKPELPGCWVF